MASEMPIEVLYIRNLLENMGFVKAPDTPVYEDNAACIEWGNHVICGQEEPSTLIFTNTSRMRRFRTARERLCLGRDSQ